MAWLGRTAAITVAGVEGSPALEDFVRARVEEELLIARLSLSVSPSVLARGRGRGSVRARMVTDALDRWALLAVADSADRDERPEVATHVRRRLAHTYAEHGDFDPIWR